MSTEISDTKLFDEKEQSAEKFPETDSKSQTPLSSAHANNININPLQDDHEPLASPSLTHGNNKDQIEDLCKPQNFDQITMKLFQDFLSFLDERTKHETATHNQKRNENIRQQLIQASDIHPNPTPHDSLSENSIMRKLTSIQLQLERMQHTKGDPKQQQKRKRPETRACFRCDKIGHVAKFCRSKFLTKHIMQSRAQNSAQSHQKRTLFPPRPRAQSHPTKPNSFQYDPCHNWALPILHSRKLVPSRNQPHTETQVLPPAALPTPRFSPETQGADNIPTVSKLQHFYYYRSYDTINKLHFNYSTHPFSTYHPRLIHSEILILMFAARATNSLI